MRTLRVGQTVLLRIAIDPVTGMITDNCVWGTIDRMATEGQGEGVWINTEAGQYFRRADRVSTEDEEAGKALTL